MFCALNPETLIELTDKLLKEQPVLCYKDKTFCSGSRTHSDTLPVCVTTSCHRHIVNIPDKVLHPGPGDFAWPIAWADFRKDCQSYTKV